MTSIRALVGLLAIPALLGAPLSAFATPPPAIREGVAVCDPNAPGNCSGGAASTNGSGTITSGGAFQTALAASQTRKGCLIQNPTTASEVLYVNVGSASPTKGNSFSLAAGASFSCQAPGIVVTDTIKVEGDTTSHAFVMTSQ